MNWHDNTSIVIISYSIKLHMCVSVCLQVISASKYITHRNLGLTTGQQRKKHLPKSKIHGQNWPHILVYNIPCCLNTLNKFNFDRYVLAISTYVYVYMT